MNEIESHAKMVIISSVSILLSAAAVIIAYLRYKEYKNSVQRSIYSELVGEVFEYELSGETQTFRVENVNLIGRWRPSSWMTAVFVEFEMEEFPWEYEEKQSYEQAMNDMFLSFELIGKETPNPANAEFFRSYNAPAMVVVFPTTNLFEIREFLRKTQAVIGDVLEHHKNKDVPMGTLLKFYADHFELMMSQEA